MAALTPLSLCVSVYEKRENVSNRNIIAIHLIMNWTLSCIYERKRSIEAGTTNGRVKNRCEANRHYPFY